MPSISTERVQSALILRALLEHREPESALYTLRTLASGLARHSRLGLVSSESFSLYVELLNQINPAYAKYFARHYSRVCNLQRSPKRPAPSLRVEEKFVLSLLSSDVPHEQKLDHAIIGGKGNTHSAGN